MSYPNASESVTLKKTFVFSKTDISILIGNILDHFDTALYSLLAPILAPIFFPNHDPVVQLILAYSVLTTSIVTRPIGAVLSGVIAQKTGAAPVLAYSLISTAIVVMVQGLIPTHEQMGYVAPLSLIILRILKGIAASSEVTVAKLYITENKTQQDAFKASSWYQMSTMFGIVLASAASTVVFISGNHNLWRAFFILAGIVGIIGYIIRFSTITKQRNHYFDTQHSSKTDLQYPKVIESIWKNKIPFLKITAVNSFSNLTYSLSFIVMNSLVPLVTSISLASMMKLNTSLLIFDMLIIPLFSTAFKKYNPKTVMLGSSLVLALTIPPLLINLPNASLFYVIFLRIWIVFWGVLFLCPLNVWCKDLLNSSEKYLINGVASALASSTIGKLTPVICLSLWHFTGNFYTIALYILAVTFSAIIAVYKS